MRLVLTTTTLLTAVVLSACAHKDMRGHHGGPRMLHDEPTPKFATCRGNGTCNIDVNFASGTCELWTDPDGLLVQKTGASDRTKLNFHLRNNGFQFPANGIEFATGSPMACERKADRLFVCENAHRTGSYKYIVRVSGACGGSTTHEKDPFVMND